MSDSLNSINDLNIENLREIIRKSAVEFKKNWISFAKILSTVYKEQIYRSWGYSNIYEYAKKELFIKKETVFKLLSSYDFVLEENIQIEGENIPPLDTISGLVKIKEKVNKKLKNEEDLDQEEINNIKNNFENIKNEVLKKGLSLNTIVRKSKEFFKDKNDDEESENKNDNDINLTREEKKRALFHLKRLSSILIKEDTPINIINSIKDLEEYLS